MRAGCGCCDRAHHDLPVFMKLLALLADGAVHSGEALAAQLQISRSAVWKHIERLRVQGIAVSSLPRAGYRLDAPLELLDAAIIRDCLGARTQARLESLEVPFEVDSTNTRLLEGAKPPAGKACVMLTERQVQGRGRRGRAWIAPFGRNLALSVSWEFEEAPGELSALSLAAGVGVARALQRIGARGVGLKWPNDIWYRDRKMGGILLEMRGEAAGPALVVIGVGLNVTLAPTGLTGLPADAVAPAAVAEACAQTPSRNALASALIAELIDVLSTFGRSGFAPFVAPWSELDVLRDRPARLRTGEREQAGTAMGIDADGALLMRIDGATVRFVSGEASLRMDRP